MLEIFLTITIIILVIFLILLYTKYSSLKQTFNDLRFRKASQSVKYGQLTEQWIPFSEKFPYEAQNFSFIGKPIDGIVFDDSGIIFCEFKTATSKLNQNQKKIKQQVLNKNIDWLEFRID